jgi:hypothetical protein
MSDGVVGELWVKEERNWKNKSGMSEISGEWKRMMCNDLFSLLSLCDFLYFFRVILVSILNVLQFSFFSNSLHDGVKEHWKWEAYNGIICAIISPSPLKYGQLLLMLIFIRLIRTDYLQFISNSFALWTDDEFFLHFLLIRFKTLNKLPKYDFFFFIYNFFISNHFRLRITRVESTRFCSHTFETFFTNYTRILKVNWIQFAISVNISWVKNFFAIYNIKILLYSPFGRIFFSFILYVMP